MAAAVHPHASLHATTAMNTSNSTSDDQIDNEQLVEYREMIEELGTFPDKVLINTLTMIAEDYAEEKESASKIYDCIRSKLLSVSGDHKLPIIYVIDSILKNAKGTYISIIEEDAKTWMSTVYIEIPDKVGKEKLKKVWNTWNTFSVFAREKWEEMGACFSSNTAGDDNSGDNSLGNINHNSDGVAGIPRSKTGTLILTPALRKEMQKVLDELQNDIDNELEKVSLERLADINPDLLSNIKRAAEESLRSNRQTTSGGTSAGDENQNNASPSFFQEIRTEEAVARSKAWAKVELKHETQTNQLIQLLRKIVTEKSSPESRYTQSDAIDMTHVLAAADCAAGLLTRALERRQNQAKKDSKSKSTSGSASAGYSSVDKSLFTNDGIKKKNMALIEMLYNVGLPFVSSSDGRRFKTQLELSKHLDRLFKRSQIEKSMARTEERGWYQSDRVWTGEATEEEVENATGPGISDVAGTSEEDANPDSFTEVADESRDRCVVCGINFKMFFDNDDGAYKYKNCREIEVMNDDVAANESDMMLVHVTCWRGLGSPETLDIDQTLQETRHF